MIPGLAKSGCVGVATSRSDSSTSSGGSSSPPYLWVPGDESAASAGVVTESFGGVDHWRYSVGEDISFALEIPGSANYTVTLVAAAAADRDIRIFINDINTISTTTFNGTGSATTFGSQVITTVLPLTDSSTVIRLRRLASTSGDISIRSVALEAS